MREREILFNDFLSELRRKEKDEKHHKKEQVRKNSMTNTLPFKNIKNFTQISTRIISTMCVSMLCENFLSKILFIEVFLYQKNFILFYFIYYSLLLFILNQFIYSTSNARVQITDKFYILLLMSLKFITCIFNHHQASVGRNVRAIT